MPSKFYKIMGIQIEKMMVRICDEKSNTIDNFEHKDRRYEICTQPFQEIS